MQEESNETVSREATLGLVGEHQWLQVVAQAKCALCAACCAACRLSAILRM